MNKGYTQIQNNVLEALSTAELSGSAYRIIICVIRKTNGWQKTDDWISFSQFEELTGLSRYSVGKEIKRLVSAKILLVSKTKPPRYKVNTDTENWVVSKTKLVSKSILGGKYNQTAVVSITKPKVVSITKPTKEKKKTNTKETNTKESEVEILNNVNVELREVVDYYNLIFDKNIKSTKAFEKNFRMWREVHDIEKIKTAIQKASVDKFWKDKMTLTILFRQKNTNGENVDYIEDLFNRNDTYQGNIAII